MNTDQTVTYRITKREKKELLFIQNLCLLDAPLRFQSFQAQIYVFAWKERCLATSLVGEVYT